MQGRRKRELTLPEQRREQVDGQMRGGQERGLADGGDVSRGVEEVLKRWNGKEEEGGPKRACGEGGRDRGHGRRASESLV